MFQRDDGGVLTCDKEHALPKIKLCHSPGRRFCRRITGKEPNLGNGKGTARHANQWDITKLFKPMVSNAAHDMHIRSISASHPFYMFNEASHSSFMIATYSHLFFYYCVFVMNEIAQGCQAHGLQVCFIPWI